MFVVIMLHSLVLASLVTSVLCPFPPQGFVKVVKNKAYFKRYEVKFRRRRGERVLSTPASLTAHAPLASVPNLTTSHPRVFMMLH